MDYDSLAKQYGGSAASNNLDELAKQYGGSALDKGIKAPAPKERTFGEAATDIAASVGKGIGQTLQVPGQLYNLVAGNVSTEKPTGLEGLGKALEEKSEAAKSESLKAKEAERSRIIQEAEGKGIWEQAKAAGASTIKDPALLISFLAEMAPNLIPVGLAARGTSAAVLGGAALRGVGKEAAAAAAQKAGTSAAIGAGAVMQGADIGTDAMTEAYKTQIEKGVPEDQAKAEAVKVGRAAGLSGAAISLIAQRLPGARQMEEAFAGKTGAAGRLVGGVKTGLGEAYSEAAEEGGGAFSKNLALREVNPEQSLTKGVGTAAALGAIGGAGLGGATGVLQQQEAPPKPQETPKPQPRTHLNEEDTLQSHPVHNPTGSFTATELGDLATQVNDYRESEGKHPLKSFSIEDLVDAKIEPAQLDSLVASKTGYQGQSIDAGQVQQAAKNIDLQSQGAKDFLTRATGTYDLNSMTPAQLYAAYTGLNNLPPDANLEEGTNAHNFKKFDYEGALENLNTTLVSNPFMDRASVIAQIKQNNPDERQADSILKSALRNGDLALTTTPHFDLTNEQGEVVFSTPNREIADRAAAKENLTVKESESDAIHLPSTTITAEELTGPANSYDLRAGNVLLNAVKSEEDAYKQAIRYNQIRNEERSKLRDERIKLLDEVQKDKTEIERMEATGMRGTPDYENRLAESTAKAEDAMKKVQQLEMRQIALDAPVAIVPTQIDTAFKPSVANAATEIHKNIAPLLKKYGLESVSLKIVDSIRNGEAEGNYAQQIISVALDNEPGTHLGVMRHEILHALKELGAFTDKEWEVLNRQAQKVWVPQYMKERSTSYKGQQTSLYDAYRDIYKEEKLRAGEITQEEYDNDDPKGLEGFDDYIQEEAIAEAFRHWKPQAGFFGNMGYRLKELFNAIRNAFKGLGFQTADTVFKNIEAGKVKEGTGEARQKRFSLKTTEPESLEIIEGKSKPDLGKKVTVDTVGAYFDNIVAQEFGGPLDYNNKEAYDRAVGIATKEVEYQLKQVNSGLDWYEEDVKKAFEDTEKVIPELKSVSKRQLFTVVAAIMSPQTNARDNWFIAAKAFKHYIDTGTMPGENPDTGGLWQGGTQSANKKKQLDFLNNMLQQLGEEATIDWITSEHTVRELNEYRRIYGGMGPGVSGKATDIESGFYAFGPKVGPFCSNLNGIYDVTVDKWMTRTFNRYFGRMVDANGKIVDAPTEPQRRVVKNLVNEVAKNANVKNYQVQSLLWFFEQRLFRELGTAAPSYGFSDGGRKVLSELGRAKGNEPSGGAAENAEGKLSLKAKVKPKERFALALGKIEPDTVVVPDNNDDPNGALGYMPNDRRFGGKPIIMRIGRKEFEEAVDRRGREEKGMRKGYGLNHILYRQEDIDHRPEPITRELAEDILREANKIASTYTRIFKDPRPDKNPNSLILATPIAKNGKFDTLIVRPGPDGFEVITMFRQTVGKFGGPIFTGRNVQRNNPRQYLLKTPIRLPVVSGKTGAEPKPPPAPKKRTLSAEAIAEMKRDLNVSKRYSLKHVQDSEVLRGIVSDETLDEIQLELEKFSGEKPTPDIDPKYVKEAVDLLTPFMEKAASYKGAFDDIVRDIAHRANGDAKIPGLKGMKRASEKLAGEERLEKGTMDPANIQDLLRATIIVPNETDIGTVIREIGEAFPITREKNRFKNPLPSGYRDILLNVMTPVGVKAEIQINIPPMIAAKDTGHILYEMLRAEPEGSARKDYLEELSSRLYDSAYLFSQNFKSSGVTSERNMRNLSLENSLEGAIANTNKPSLSSTTGTPSTSQSLAPAGTLNTTGSKLSLRSQLPASINARIDATTGQRQTVGFMDRILSILNPETRAKLRAGFIFQFEALERGTKARAAKYGNREYMADVSATAAALESMRSKQIVAAAMRDGVPVYRNGFTTTDNFNGTQKGLLEIFSPLAQTGDPDVWRCFQFYAGSKRGARLDAEGREHLFTRQDLNEARAMAAQFNQMGIDFDAVYKEYQKWNEALVKYMKDTGVLSAADAAYFTRFGDYIPFYRQIDGEATVGPKIFSSIAGVQKPKVLKGGTEKLGDFLENVIRNASAAVESGMKNVAANRGIRDALDLGTAHQVPVPNQDTVSIKENGVTKHYELDDRLLFEAFKGLNIPRLPWLQILAKPADVLRNFVTKDPGFILANIMRDSVSAWVTSGSDMVPVIDSFKQFGKILAGKSPEAAAMARAGLGGYEFKGSLKDSADSFEKALRAKTGTRTKTEKALLPLTKLWDMLEQGSNASDMATRAEVYKRVLAETGNEAEALFQASEVMNFSRKGNFPIIQAVTALVPFMNARIQGMDVLYRSGFGQAANANKERMQKAFIVRSLSILALSAMYWAMVHDDDEYKKLTKEERDGYWIVPGLTFNGKPFRFPIPFEIGVVFKVLPERVLEYTMGQDTEKDLAESLKRNLLDTLKFNPMPQAFVPFYENITNHSFFTGEKIVGRGLEDVAKPLQYNASTTMGARWLGEQTGMSPIQIDNVVRGYTGTMGMYAMNMLDSFFTSQGDPVKATTRAEQLPVIKRFFASDSGTVAQYYDLKDEVDEVVRTVNFLSLNNPDKLEAYLKDNENTYMLKDFVSSIEKDMKQIREYRNAVNADPSIGADEKRTILDELHQYEIQLTSDIKAIRKEYH